MKKIFAILIVCAGSISCNNNDTSRIGTQDSTKASLDDPKEVIVDSSKITTESSMIKKDSAQ